MRRLTLVCDDRQARRIERLASQYDLTEREVLRQLIDLGFDALDSEEREVRDEKDAPAPDG
ncbi:CopG family transcriptional regulator [Halobacteriales archaeon QS_5_70_15]|nr:MAG: CopG family transcriptional regulator [Halobacteriales archaeon QS_5_70_15]